MINVAEFDKVTRSQAERYAPMFTYAPPTFTNKKEAMAYREQEVQRWYEGYNGLDGWHYKWLTQYRMKDGVGRIIRPVWRDGDHYIVFKTLKDAMERGDDKFTLKRREFGLSSIDGGFVPIEVAIRNPGCVIKLTSADEDRVKNLMQEKVEVMASNIFSDAELQWKKVSGTSGNLFRPKISYTTTDMNLTIDFGEGIRSTIQGVQTSKGIKSSKKMEGPRLAYAFIDEFFLHEFASRVRLSADAARNVGLSRAGIISLGGSAGDSTEDGARAAQDLWYNHDKYNMQILFLPGTLCIEKADEIDDRGVKTGRTISFMVNGYSLQQEAYEWIGKVRKTLNSLVDKTAYWQFVKQYPLHVEEVFETTSNNIWDASEKQRFEAQKKLIFVSPKATSLPKALMLNEFGAVEMRDSVSSPVKIIHPPKQGFNYVVGVDPIPIITRTENDKASEYAAAIKCIEENVYCGYYMERSKDSSRLARQTYLLQKLYNNAPAMIERNRADAIFDEYRRNGWWDMLAWEPLPMRSSNAKTSEKGYSKTGHNADNLIDHLLKWARSYDEEMQIGGIESIWDSVMLEQLYTLDVGNKDLADAMVGCEVYHWWIKEKQFRKEKFNGQASSLSKKVPIKVMRNGRVEIEYVDVNYSGINRFGRGWEIRQ